MDINCCTIDGLDQIRSDGFCLDIVPLQLNEHLYCICLIKYRIKSINASPLLTSIAALRTVVKVKYCTRTYTTASSASFAYMERTARTQMTAGSSFKPRASRLCNLAQAKPAQYNTI